MDLSAIMWTTRKQNSQNQFYKGLNKLSLRKTQQLLNFKFK